MLATSRSWTLAETMVVRRYPAGCKLFWRGSGQCSRMRCASPPLFLSYHWFLGALVGPLRRRLRLRAADRIPKLIPQSKKRGNVMYNRLPTTACVSPPTRPIRSHARRSGLSWKRTRLIWTNFSSGERASRFAQAAKSRGAADRGQRGEAAGAAAQSLETIWNCYVIPALTRGRTK